MSWAPSGPPEHFTLVPFGFPLTDARSQPPSTNQAVQNWSCSKLAAEFSALLRGRATTCFQAGDFRRGDRTRSAWHRGEALSIWPRVPRFRSLKETSGIGLPTDGNCYTAG